MPARHRHPQIVWASNACASADARSDSMHYMCTHIMHIYTCNKNMHVGMTDIKCRTGGKRSRGPMEPGANGTTGKWNRGRTEPRVNGTCSNSSKKGAHLIGGKWNRGSRATGSGCRQTGGQWNHGQWNRGHMEPRADDNHSQTHVYTTV